MFNPFRKPPPDPNLIYPGDFVTVHDPDGPLLAMVKDTDVATQHALVQFTLKGHTYESWVPGEALLLLTEDAQARA